MSQIHAGFFIKRTISVEVGRKRSKISRKYIDRRLEKKGTGSYRTKLTIETNKIVGEADIRNFLLSMGIKNTKMIKFEVYNKKSINITYLIEGKSSDLKRIPKEIEKINWIDNLKFE